MTVPADLWSATSLANGVATGNLTARSVLEQSFERIDDRNGSLNALIRERRAAALNDADQIDRRVRTGLQVGPLAGVPFTVKDVISTAGLATTCGSAVMNGSSTDPDASAVGRLRAAGAILIGKTNCPEFAFSLHTENRRFGRTLNPLGPFTVGGSSGGEAAALAAGFSAFGIGTDFGGSIRWPAQCVNVIGLRPTVGRVPGTGQLPGLGHPGAVPPNPLTLQGRLQVIGPLARTVDDLELILRVMQGPDGIDPTAVPVPLNDSRAVDLTGVELHWGADLGLPQVDPEITTALARTAETLSTHLGTVTTGLPPQLEEAVSVYSKLRALEPLLECKNAAAGRESGLTDAIRALLLGAVSRDETAKARLWSRRDLLRRDLLDWLSGDRVLMLPVSTIPPFEVDGGGPGEFLLADVLAPCRAVALFGCPAISIPVGQTQSGLPLSVQLVGAPFREDVIFSVARILEVDNFRNYGQ